MTPASIRATCAAMALAALTLGSPALAAKPAADPSQDRTPAIHVNVDAGAQSVGFVEDAYVAQGQIHDGDLVSIMGNVRVDGKVTGTVVVVMGSIEIGGDVEGEVVSVMSRAHLGPNAHVGGQMVGVGWSIARDVGSRVEGEIVNIGFMNLVPFAGQGGLAGFLRFLLIVHLITLAFLFLVLLIITALIPRRLSVMADAFPTKWGWSFLTGVLTYAGVVIGVVILACTIIGIPLALLLAFLAAVAKWIGLAALCYLIGRTAGRNLFNRELPHLACVLGGFVVYALLSLVPFVGWVFSMLMKILGVGLALYTKFGAEPAPQPLPSAAPPLAGATAPPVVS
jgi:hypothetical protein